MTHPQLQRLRDEWRRSRRLRLGALAVFAILGAHAALAMSDRLQAREEAFHRDAQLLGRLEEASREAGWPARAQAAEAALARERHSIPPARSDGLAQAEMQAWLTDLAVFAGVAGPSVRVETSLPVPGQPGTWQVLARLDGQTSPTVMPVLSRALTSALPWVRTERLEVGGGDIGHVSVVVRGYYRQGDALDARAPPARPAELPAAASAPVAAQAPRNPLARPAGDSADARPANPLARPRTDAAAGQSTGSSARQRPEAPTRQRPEASPTRQRARPSSRPSPDGAAKAKGQWGTRPGNGQ